MLGFNIDTGFASSLDCLILIDLRKTEPRLLRKYMSEGGRDSSTGTAPTHRAMAAGAGPPDVSRGSLVPTLTAARMDEPLLHS